MSDATVGLVQRRRRSCVEAEQLVREYQSSGLTRQAFCAGRGLSVAALDKYRRQHRSGVGAGAGRMIAVEVLPEPGVRSSRSGSALWVELPNGRRIGVGSGFDAAALQRLIQVVEQA
jgi:hypothetical protein